MAPIMMSMHTISVVYDPTTRRISLAQDSDSYGGATTDVNSVEISVSGIVPDGTDFRARVDFNVPFLSADHTYVRPYVELTQDNDVWSGVIPVQILKATEQTRNKLQFQLLISNEDYVINSRNSLTLNVTEAIDADTGELPEYEMPEWEIPEGQTPISEDVYSINLDYDPNTRKLTLDMDDNYGGTTIDTNSVAVIISGVDLTGQVQARLDFAVPIKTEDNVAIKPFVPLEQVNNALVAIIPQPVLMSARELKRLPFQLVLRHDDVIINSRNAITLEITRAINAMESIVQGYVPYVMLRDDSWGWLEDFTYKEGAVVTYEGQIYVSLIDDNLGLDPAENPEAWDEIIGIDSVSLAGVEGTRIGDSIVFTEEQIDSLIEPPLVERVPAPLPAPSLENSGKAIISDGSGYVFGEAGKVDDVLVNGTSVVSNKIASVTVPTAVSQLTNDTGYLTELGFDGLTDHPTTIAGYGITDVKIDNGTITLGNSSITPVTDVSGKANVNLDNISGLDTDNVGKAILVSSTGGIEFGEAGKVDQIQINGTPIAGEGTQTKIANIPVAASDSLGVVKIGSNINISGGAISVPTATSAVPGVVQLVTAENLNPGDTSITVPTEAKMEQFVNSSIATNTAYFLGTYDVEFLGLTDSATHEQVAAALNAKTTWLGGRTPSNNDYCFVYFDYIQDPGNVDRYDRYKYDGSTWGYEYTLNNSSFTQAQWAAINSLISNSGNTGIDVQTILSHIGDSRIHVPTEVYPGRILVSTTNAEPVWRYISGSGYSVQPGGNILITNTTYSGGTKITLDESTHTFNHDNTPHTTSSVEEYPTYGASFTVLGDIRTDETGHITYVNYQTVHLPNSDNTDMRVQQSLGQNGGYYPLLMSSVAGANTDLGPQTSVFSPNVIVIPDHPLLKISVPDSSDTRGIEICGAQGSSVSGSFVRINEGQISFQSSAMPYGGFTTITAANISTASISTVSVSADTVTAQTFTGDLEGNAATVDYSGIQNNPFSATSIYITEVD